VCHECLDPLFRGIKALAGLVAAIEVLGAIAQSAKQEKTAVGRIDALRDF
jgi:hypothetical protein